MVAVALSIVAHAGWDELLVAAVAVGIVLVLRLRSEKRHRLEEEADEVASQEARR